LEECAQACGLNHFELFYSYGGKGTGFIFTKNLNLREKCIALKMVVSLFSTSFYDFFAATNRYLVNFPNI
jgi:hypothetical protein